MKNGNTDFAAFYVNGNLITSTNASTQDLGVIDHIVIGNDYRGMMDDVALMSTALTQADVQLLIAANTNQAPVISDLDGDLVNYGLPGSGPVNLDDVGIGATVNDPDAPANFDGATLTISTVAGAEAGPL